MGKTKIEWTDATWNPITGCSHVSEGCRNCYAERLDRRQMMKGRQDGFKPWTAQNAEYNVRLHPERLEQPLRWRRPRRVFVCSMGDLFHEQVPDEFICDVFGVMEKAKRHIFQVLTKRPKRMLDLLLGGKAMSGLGPPKNIWWGISAEDQPTFDERSRFLIQTPAAKRFVSLEPLLAPVSLSQDWVDSLAGWYTETESAHDCDGTEEMCMRRCPVPVAVQVQTEKLDWVIVGGESGPGARPMHLDWVRSIRDDCQIAGVPYFFKQWGEWIPEELSQGLWPEKASGDPIARARKIHVWPDHAVSIRHGKKAAGRELDGRTWDEMPV